MLASIKLGLETDEHDAAEAGFSAMFKPEGVNSPYWWGEPYTSCLCSAPESETPRVLALLFMGEMVDSA